MPLELQAALSDRLAFDLFSLQQDGLGRRSVLCLKSALRLERRDEQGQAEAEQRDHRRRR